MVAAFLFLSFCWPIVAWLPRVGHNYRSASKSYGDLQHKEILTPL